LKGHLDLCEWRNGASLRHARISSGKYLPTSNIGVIGRQLVVEIKPLSNEGLTCWSAISRRSAEAAARRL